MISGIELKNFGKINQLKLENLNNKNIFLTGPNGSGKCLDVMTPILTPNGWVRMKDIHVGDTVFDVDGNECKVTGEYPQPCKLGVYRITFSDNCYIDCCKDHKWMYTPRGLNNINQDWVIGTTEQMVEQLEQLKETNDGLAVPVCKPINYVQTEKLPIDPYVMGILLSSGKMPKSKAASIVAKDPEIAQKIAVCLIKIAIVKQDKGNKNLWWLIDDVSDPKHSFSYIIEHIGIRGVTMKDRFIPKEYLRANVENRKRLLQGLMDGGGYINPRTGVMFKTGAPGLFRDFVELVRSLGYRCTTVKKYREDLHHNEYMVDVHTRDIIYSAPRLITTTKKFHKKPKHVGNYDVLMIKRIVKLKKAVEMKCLEVDSPTHTYITKNYIPTHNTTVLQAISLALTGKIAKGLTIDKYIGPKGDDFSVILTLDDGTKIGRTSKKSKLKLPDGRVYNKTKDVYEQLPFDPLMLYNLSYVKQGEISDLFSAGGKAVIDKLVGMVINSKRLNDGYATITKNLNVNRNVIDTLSDTISANSNQYNEDEVRSIKRQIEVTKARLAKASCNITAEEINKYVNIHNAYKQAQANYEAVKAVKIDIPNKPTITEDVARDKLTKYKAYTQAVEKRDEIKKSIEEWVVIQNNAEPIKEFLDLDLRLIGNQYSVEQLSEIANKNSEFKSVMLTENHYMSEKEANDEFDRYYRNRNIDSQNIIKAKETFERIRSALKPIEAKVKELKMNGYTSDTFDARVRINLNALSKNMVEVEEQIGQNYQPNPITEDVYYNICNEWTNYRRALKEASNYENRIREYKSEADSLAEQLKSIPSMDEIAEMRSVYAAKEEIKNSLASLTRHLGTLESIKDQMNEARERIRTLEKENVRLAYWKSILADAPVKLRQGLFGPVVDCFNKQFYSLFSFGSLGEISIDWGKYQINVGRRAIEQCSGAQMVALGLCMRLALLTVMGSYIPIMMVDEPTIHLDDERKNDVRNLLSVMSKYSQIIASTHDDSIITDGARVVDMSMIK